MRVCFLAPELLPNQGGVGTYSVELLRQMAGRVDLTVLTPLRSRDGERYDRGQIESYFGHKLTALTISEARDTFVYNARFQRAVRKTVPKIARSEGVDVLHSQHAHMPDLLLDAKSRALPTVRTIHTTIEGQREGIRIARAAGAGLESSERWQIVLAPLLQASERSILGRPGARFVAVSEWMRDHLASKAIDPLRIRVIHCGGDPERFRPGLRDTSRLRSTPDSRTVLFPGRPTVVKGASILARAIPLVLQRLPLAEFRFTGGGEEEFLRLASFPPAVRDHVRFLGYLPYEELPGVFASADLMVAPTFYENFPIRILESMASGVPVVASAVGGIPESVVPRRTGLLVPPGDPEALASAIAELLASDDAREAYGRAARELILDKYTWRRAADATLDCYRETMNAAALGTSAVPG